VKTWEEVMMDEIVTTLKSLKPTIMTHYKVVEISLFGSFARGEQHATSDVDLLVEFESDADLFDLIGLNLYLEDILQRKVDVVPKRTLRVELKETVLEDIIAL
jgi:hypothetical protein